MKKTMFIAAALLVGLSAAAQKGNIGYVYPAGACRGTTVEVTVGGQNLSKATGIVISGKGVKGELIPAAQGPKKKGRKNRDIGEEDNLQLADKVTFRLTVDKDAALGMRDVRLMTPGGMTNRLYFEVGELPDVAEDPSGELSAAATLLPVTFNGQVMRSDVDRFRFPARKGQQLVLKVRGRVFVPYMADAVPGWFQPIIRLFGPDGKEVAFNDDYRYEVDPVLFFEVPSDGDYVVMINDALYRGREDFVYRIDVGELPFITSVSPLGGPAGVRNKVTLTGYNLKSDKLRLPASGPGRMPVTTVGKNGLHSNTMWFCSDDRPALDTRKLAPDTAESSAWDLPAETVCGNCFTAPMQMHWYQVEVADRKPVHFSVQARRLGSPADVRITLFDAYMNKVQDVDDTEDPAEFMATHFADPEMTLPLKPGRYLLRVSESQSHFGPEYAYRLSWGPAEPDFTLNIEPATISVPEGGSAVFTVQMTPRQNYHGGVDISVKGLPAGFSLSGNRIEPGRKKTLVSITAPSGAEKGTLNPKVSGTSDGNGPAVTREAVPAESMMQAFYYTHLMPMEDFRVEVGEKTPFRVKVVRDSKGPLRLSRGGTTALRVHLDRDPGFDSPVTLMLKSSEQFVKAEAVVIPEGESDGVLEVVARDVKAKRTAYPRLSVYGVVKGSSSRIAGKGRNAFVASVTAYAPVVIAEVPARK